MYEKELEAVLMRKNHKYRCACRANIFEPLFAASFHIARV